MCFEKQTLNFLLRTDICETFSDTALRKHVVLMIIYGFFEIVLTSL